MWTARALGRSPLTRVADCVQAWAVVIAFVMLVAAVFPASAVGQLGYEAHSQAVAADATSRHPVDATALGVSKADSSGSESPTTTFMVNVRWSAQNTTHESVARVDGPVKAGDRVQIWMTDQGNVTTPPPTDTDDRLMEIRRGSPGLADDGRSDLGRIRAAANPTQPRSRSPMGPQLARAGRERRRIRHLHSLSARPHRALRCIPFRLTVSFGYRAILHTVFCPTLMVDDWTSGTATFSWKGHEKMTAGDATGDAHLTVEPPEHWATGLPAVRHALQFSLEHTSLRRTALNLLTINQTNGIDCPGCAWPEPRKRHLNEYCENGAKHVNDEATTRRVTRDFFREHPVSELATKSDMWLNEQGRLTEPMVKRPGADHYEPIGWDDAFELLAAELRGLDSPDEALFYTSGPAQQRGRVPAAAVRARLRHQQPARLQQHVPRVQRLRPGRDPRHRQGQRQPRGHPRSRPRLRRRHQPGHQHPADALRAGGDQAQRWPGHRRQPAARGRTDPVQEPAEGQGHHRPRHHHRRPVPADPARRRPRALPGPQRAAAGGGGRRSGQRARPRLHRPRHDRLRRVRRARPADRLGPMCLPRPG